MTNGVERMATSTGVMLADPEGLGNELRGASQALFDPRFWQARGELHAVSGGRGSAWFIGGADDPWVLRHYRRGGFVARFSTDRYLWVGEEGVRAFREWRLLAWLWQRGLPVPKPIAAWYQRSGPSYRCDLITRRIPNTQTLSAALASHELSFSTWNAIGAVIARLHHAGVDHADLNAHNILLDKASADSDGAVSVIDFDRGRLRNSGAWTEANLKRLHRSLTKISRAMPAPRFTQAAWDSLMVGYQSARLRASPDGQPPASHPPEARPTAPQPPTRRTPGQASRRLYSFLIVCAAPVAFVLLLCRGLRERGYWQGLGERFGWGAPVEAPAIWLHAVSLGEMSAAAPLIQTLLARHPEMPLLLTTATPSGRRRAQSQFGGAAQIRFLPYDTPGAVRRFLSRARPRLAIIMETELWPNLFAQLEARGIPVILASARLSAKSVSRYRRFGALFSGVFGAGMSIGAQSADDAERFRAIGAAAAQTQVLGNVKFDVQLDGAIADRGRELRIRYGAARPVWIAGSTHAGEEEQVLDAHALLREHRPDALLLLVPRACRSFPQRRRPVGAARRALLHALSEGSPLGSATPVLLVDSLGELTALYAAADVAFVGGSLVPVGGHNLVGTRGVGAACADRAIAFQCRGHCPIVPRERRSPGGA